MVGRVALSSLAPDGLAARLRHAARQKLWQRALLVLPHHLVFVELLDAGALAGGSAWVLERDTGAVRFDRGAGGVSGLNGQVGERPGPGARASFTAPGIAMTLERRSDRFRLTADLGQSFQLDALLDTRGAPEPFALIGPLPEDGLRAVQVSGPLPLAGTMSLRGRSHELDGGLGVLEYGAGLFPHACGWRKLTAAGRLADGRAVALHLADGPAVAGDEDGGENALLLGSHPAGLPAVMIELDPNTSTTPCRILSRDGSVDLVFNPLATHHENRGLLVASLSTTQLAG
jgi:hypothetical protein